MLNFSKLTIAKNDEDQHSKEVNIQKLKLNHLGAIDSGKKLCK